MSMMFVALMMAQAPATVQPAAPAAPAAKKKQVCEYIEVTGSRSKRRVCRNEEGVLDLGPGVSNSGYGKARIDPQNGASSSTGGGPGGN